MKVIVDQDPDYPDFFSIWTDYPGHVNAELVGKIGYRAIADYLAKHLEQFEWKENPYEQ